MALRRLLPLLLLLSLESLDLLPGAHGARGRAANRTLSAGAAAVGGRRPGGALARGGRELNGTARAPGVPEAGNRRGQPAAAVAAAAASSAVTYETCWGYYDVSGQYDKEFECNNSESGYLYCCGTCYYRFCCKKRHEKLDQRQCTNYQSPVWVQTPSTKVVSPGPENKYDPEKDKTNFTVYITCGVIAFVIVAGVFAKVSYDKAHRPPREMNIHSFASAHRHPGILGVGGIRLVPHINDTALVVTEAHSPVPILRFLSYGLRSHRVKENARVQKLSFGFEDYVVTSAVFRACLLPCGRKDDRLGIRGQEPGGRCGIVALADILRQQGPIPIAHCEREAISAIDTSPKENTPVRSSSKNHYTPVRTAKQTPGLYPAVDLTSMIEEDPLAPPPSSSLMHPLLWKLGCRQPSVPWPLGDEQDYEEASNLQLLCECGAITSFKLIFAQDSDYSPDSILFGNYPQGGLSQPGGCNSGNSCKENVCYIKGRADNLSRVT
ncbi:Protein shisa-6 [Galemys pyrenaicus]|uniref:Protein shisa-6 n=1 Tax=Galemys pyrenaicus TaxID=202257 RepID=A0A8J6DW24_GALPY|nr:Protein shisa-6 [Galemys pyrenaicus]